MGWDGVDVFTQYKYVFEADKVVKSKEADLFRSQTEYDNALDGIDYYKNILDNFDAYYRRRYNS